MNVKFLKNTPKIIVNGMVLQRLRDLARLSKTKVALGGSFYFQDKEMTTIYLEDVFVVKQNSGQYYVTPDMKTWIETLDEEEKKSDVYSYAVMGLIFPNTTEFSASLPQTEINDFEKNIGTVYNTYVYFKINKNFEFEIGIVDNAKGIIVEKVDYELDLSDLSEEEKFIEEELNNVSTSVYHSYTSSSYTSSYSNNGYTSGYQTSYGSSYIKQEPVYEDAEINTKNPKFTDLV